jgi:hypothetical protein
MDESLYCWSDFEVCFVVDGCEGDVVLIGEMEEDD